MTSFKYNCHQRFFIFSIQPKNYISSMKFKLLRGCEFKTHKYYLGEKTQMIKYRSGEVHIAKVVENCWAKLVDKKNITLWICVTSNDSSNVLQTQTVITFSNMRLNNYLKFRLPNNILPRFACVEGSNVKWHYLLKSENNSTSLGFEPRML